MVQQVQSTYPGATIRETRLRRGDELGFVVIQDWFDTNPAGMRYRIGSFTPGVDQWVEGDTPKIWPDYESYKSDPVAAVYEFYRHIALAFSLGWKLYKS